MVGLVGRAIATMDIGFSIAVSYVGMIEDSTTGYMGPGVSAYPVVPLFPLLQWKHPNKICLLACCATQAQACWGILRGRWFGRSRAICGL